MPAAVQTFSTVVRTGGDESLPVHPARPTASTATMAAASASAVARRMDLRSSMLSSPLLDPDGRTAEG